MSPLVSSSPEQTSERTSPSLDPDSWEATKQVEEFNRRIRDFEIEFTETAKNYYYPAKYNEILDEERHLWKGKPRTSFPNRYSFSYTAYQSAKVSGAPLQVIFDRVHEVWTYIHQAYAGGLIRPGSAPLSKIDQLRTENKKLQDQVDDLTKQLVQKDYIINHLGGRQDGELNRP